MYKYQLLKGLQIDSLLFLSGVSLLIYCCAELYTLSFFSWLQVDQQIIFLLSLHAFQSTLFRFMTFKYLFTLLNYLLQSRSLIALNNYLEDCIRNTAVISLNESLNTLEPCKNLNL